MINKVCILVILQNIVTMADCFAECYSNSENSLKIESVNDVKGRYTVKWCTDISNETLSKIQANKNNLKWMLHLRYDPLKAPKECKYWDVFTSDLHSSFEKDVSVDLNNCTNVCFKTTLDMIFNSSCYIFLTELYNIVDAEYTRQIVNNYTLDYFAKNEASPHYETDGEDVVITWDFGHVPASKYTVKVKNETDDSFSASGVAMNCTTTGPTIVHCRARLPPGNYKAIFSHETPWRSCHKFEHLGHLTFPFSHVENIKSLPETKPSSSILQWVVFGAALITMLGVLVIAGVKAYRARTLSKLRKQVMERWRRIMSSRTPGSPTPARRVLLLYARDCEQFTTAATLLGKIVERSSGYEVVDLYSPESMRAAAPAGAEWLRGIMENPDTLVLFLQSPAASFYCARLSYSTSESSSPTLQAPLLGNGVEHRCPHWADTLVQFALRLMVQPTNLPQVPLPYQKYFIASVAGVRAEVVPTVTGQRRFALGGALEQLLRALAPHDPHFATDPLLRELTAQFEEALTIFRKYISEDDRYLRREFPVPASELRSHD